MTDPQTDNAQPKTQELETWNFADVLHKNVYKFKFLSWL